MSLFRKKSLSQLLASAADSEKGLKRTLGATNLVALGIGAIIGAGLFVRTAAAAARAASAAISSIRHGTTRICPGLNFSANSAGEATAHTSPVTFRWPIPVPRSRTCPTV